MIMPLRTKRPALDRTAEEEEAIANRAADVAIGLPRRHAYQITRADPALAAPAISAEHRHRLTGAGPRPVMGTGDARPAPQRPGSQAAAQFPSRQGNLLRWPDGRVTTLDGKAVPPAPQPTPTVTEQRTPPTPTPTSARARRT